MDSEEKRELGQKMTNGKMDVLMERKRRIEDDARTLWDDVNGLRGDLREVAVPLSERFKARPTPYLVGATLVGFVVGAGLTSRVVNKLAFLGLVKLALPMVGRMVFETVIGGEEGQKSQEPPPEESPPL